MYDIVLFQHSDARSPHFYCLYRHPITGKQASFSCRTTDRAEALRYATRQLPDIIRRAIEGKITAAAGSTKKRASAREASVPLAPMLLSEYAQRYVERRRTKAGRPLKDKSRRALRDSFNQLIKSLGDKYIHAVTEEDCESFILSGQPSDRSAEKHYDNLRPAFDTAVEEGRIGSNPFRAFRPPVPSYSDEEIEERCFTPDEFEVFYSVMPSRTFAQRRLRNQLLLAFETGMRLGELRHVKTSWIDRQTAILTVKSDRRFSTKTDGPPRYIPLSHNALAAIDAQRQDNALHESEAVRSSSYLFPNRHGDRLSESAIENPFAELRRKLWTERRPRIHGLRHGLVTRLSLEGLTDRQIQDITGHSTLEMVQRYSHMKKRLVEPARAALNAGKRFEVVRPDRQGRD